MLTATYNVPASDWTRAIDAALAQWSEHIAADAEFRIAIDLVGKDGNMLAGTTNKTVHVGLTDGSYVTAPASLMRMQGGDPGGIDMTFRIVTDYPWSFDGSQPRKYDAISVMAHELGHGLGITGVNTTPFDLENHQHLAGGGHLADQSSLMWTSFWPGVARNITPADVLAISHAGMPTALDDTIYVVGPRVDGAAGHDTAVWLGKFDNFSAELSNIEVLSLRGADPLTAHQADIYRLYDAAFNRTPDLAGFAYWAASGMDAHAVASAFAASVEFAGLYTGDRSAIVTALYRNVLDREPDAGGLAYWVGSDAAPEAMLIGFALAPENTLGAINFTI